MPGMSCPDAPTYLVTGKQLAHRGIGKRYWASSLEKRSIRERPSTVAVRAYRTAIRTKLRLGEGLYLWGPYGVGKTSLAVCICKTALSLGLEAYLVQAQEIPGALIEKQHNCYLDKSLKAIFQDTDCLVIDNLNRELTGKWQSETLESIFRWRYSDSKITIITSNLDPGEMKRHLTPGCLSLFADRLSPIHVDGKSLRRVRDAITIPGNPG